MYQAVKSITDQLRCVCVCVCVCVHMYMCKQVCVWVCVSMQAYGSQSYLVLQVLGLLLLVVATVNAPDKVMEVVLEELLTVGLTH